MEKREIYQCTCGRLHVFFYDHKEEYVRHAEYDDEDEGEFSTSSFLDMSSGGDE